MRIHPRILSAMSQSNDDNLSIFELKSRIQICKKCPFWHETKYDYRCYKCGCNAFLHLKGSKCPLSKF